MYGHGASVTLGHTPGFQDVGEKFKNAPSVQNAIKTIKDAVVSRYKANKGCEGGYSEYTFYRFDVTWDYNLFAIGDGFLHTNAQCSSGSCNFDFYIEDRFEDALDLFGGLDNGYQELPGGVAYDILYNFVDSGVCVPWKYFTLF